MDRMGLQCPIHQLGQCSDLSKDGNIDGFVYLRASTPRHDLAI